MDAREFIDLVRQAELEGADYFALAAKIVEAQKECDANLAEAMGATSVAAAIRAST